MNNLKKALWVVAFALTSSFTFAQTEKEYTDLVKDALKIEIKEHVYKELNLSSAEQQAFDPIFNDYLKDQGKITKLKWSNFDGYLKLRDQYSAEKLDELNSTIWKANAEQVKLNKKYYKKFKKAIGVEKATYFFFMKRYLDNAVEYKKFELLGA